MKGMLNEFWSNIENIERTSAEDIQSDVLAYLAKITELNARLQEGIKTLELLADKNKWLEVIDHEGDEAGLVFTGKGEVHDIARTTLKRIKGDSQAEGHLSTESAQAQAGGRQGSGGSYE